MSLCKDCIKGVSHEGTPQGKWEKIGDVDSYVATPTGEYAKDKAILFLPDVFGPQLVNNQLLADDFAANGFKTIIPDIFDGDCIHADALNPGSTFDLMKWYLSNHEEPQTRPIINKVLDGFKTLGITTIGAVGYCFGGRYVFDLAFENIIKVAVASHPSLLKLPDDLEKYFATSKAPLLINSCSIDQQFPVASGIQADEIFGDGKFAPGYRREHFDGCTHGFAVRGDMSDPKVKAGKEGAFKASVEWFITKL